MLSSLSRLSTAKAGTSAHSIPQIGAWRGSAQPPENAACSDYDWPNPTFGPTELTFKLGFGIQLGPLEFGSSKYKNVTTGQTGSEMTFGWRGIAAIQSDNPTPAGGSFNGGGPEQNEWNISLLLFVRNSTSGRWRFKPSTALRFGSQVGFGPELTWNGDTYGHMVRMNRLCGGGR
jgi:hypothetical protein